MTIEERERVEALERLAAEIGQGAARAVVELLPPTDVVTRDDLAAFRDEFHRELTALRGEFYGELTALRSEFYGELTALRSELHSALTTQTRMLVLSQFATVAAFAAFVIGFA